MFKIFRVVKTLPMSLVRSRALKRTWLPVPLAHVKSITTSTTMLKKDPCDPILDVMFEDIMNKINEQEEEKIESCKMLKQDPPVSVLDIFGNPVKPIDINSWADPEEMANLFGDGNYVRRKLLTWEGDQSNEPVKDIIKVVDEIRRGRDEEIEKDELERTDNVLDQSCGLKEELKKTDMEKISGPAEEDHKK